jgi:hypothetical protein
MQRGRSLVAGALLAALLSSLSLALVTHIWSLPLHEPFEYAHSRYDNEQDATLDMMLIKNIEEHGWFDSNPKLNAPFEQRWVEWPMGGDLLSYTIKKAIVDTTRDVPFTFNLFWLLTFPLTALAAFPVLRSLRVSWASSVVGATLFSLTPYHFRNGAAHENLAFYVGVPIIVLLCVRVLGPGAGLPALRDLRHRRGWWRLRWALLGAMLVAVTGIYYVAFLLSLLLICCTIGALAHRRPSNIAMGAIFGGVALATAALANLPTLWFRWHHSPNVLGVPDREAGVSELYPLRLVALLSPGTGHRFPPFAALANQLYGPNGEGIRAPNLGLVAVIGFVCAVTVVLVRALRAGRGRGRGWVLEARLGVVVAAAFMLGARGGLSRALELFGLLGVRAWNRLAIVIAFAGIVVFARLLDRARVALLRRDRARRRPVWLAVLAATLVVGVLDQASPAAMPDPGARADLWNADAAFVSSLERQLPADAMVFQLPVVDWPEHSATERMAAHDEIKMGYLHSKRLRWSAGGVRGRDGEWQWPASTLQTRDFVRGLVAIGFSAITLDRFGYRDDGDDMDAQLEALLGPPLRTPGDRVVAWDLRPVAGELLAGLTRHERHTLAQEYLDLPRLYLSSDADPITDRGGKHNICAKARLQLVNPGGRPTSQHLQVVLDPERADVESATLTIAGRTVRVSDDPDGTRVPVTLEPGTTAGEITVQTPGVTCGETFDGELPAVEASLEVTAPTA